jgi:hypothetical protein
MTALMRWPIVSARKLMASASLEWKKRFVTASAAVMPSKR